jgi:antirestriction protein ArdC
MTTCTTETPAQALDRIRSGFSQNDAAVIHAFAAAGYGEVIPRHDVLTYRAWLGAGRQVRKGEKATKVAVWLPRTKTKKDGTTETYTIPTTASLFHISQTDPVTL